VGAYRRRAYGGFPADGVDRPRRSARVDGGGLGGDPREAVLALPLTQPPEGGTTFLGSPLAGDLATLEADVAILGIPYGVPYGMRGVVGASSRAPAAIRAKSAEGAYRILHHYDFDLDGDVLAGTDVRIVDCGDVPADPLDIPGNSRRATEAVRAILDRDAMPIVFGGDDSIPIPFFRAYEGGGPLTLVQIDAHLDFRDEVDGVSEGYSSPIRRASEMPWIERIVQIGLRGTGSARAAEVADAQANGNIIVRARDVHSEGVDMLLDHLPGNGPFLITIDFDGLDPAVAPGVGSPAPGGLTFDEAAGILRGLAARGPIAGLDLVEYDPANDLNGRTAVVAIRLVMNLLGAMIRSGIRT
jgi:agmatinase